MAKIAVGAFRVPDDAAARCYMVLDNTFIGGKGYVSSSASRHLIDTYFYRTRLVLWIIDNACESVCLFCQLYLLRNPGPFWFSWTVISSKQCVSDAEFEQTIVFCWKWSRIIFFQAMLNTEWSRERQLSSMMWRDRVLHPVRAASTVIKRFSVPEVMLYNVCHGNDSLNTATPLLTAKTGKTIRLGMSVGF